VLCFKQSDYTIYKNNSPAVQTVWLLFIVGSPKAEGFGFPIIDSAM
jgi:hypothetical protein